MGRGASLTELVAPTESKLGPCVGDPGGARDRTRAPTQDAPGKARSAPGRNADVAAAGGRPDGDPWSQGGSRQTSDLQDDQRPSVGCQLSLQEHACWGEGCGG